MIVANLFHIKTTNGLFFYGLDYLGENLDLVRVILVRPKLEHYVREAFPNSRVISCGAWEYFRQVLLACLRGDFLYTPTSHPLPFIDHQLVVMHDAYPFEVGVKSSLKRYLFKWSLVFSRCQVGYINRSEALSFIASLGLASHRLIFAPNRFPNPVKPISVVRSMAPFTIVGLLGTDSAKKNYDQLFCAVRKSVFLSCLVFRVYGHDTDYFQKVRQKFSDIQIVLVSSDEVSLDEFMSSVDVLASVSEQEGFGRPIASALLAGLPVELLDRPVFREFFTGGARFHSDLDSLVRSLHRFSFSNMLDTPYTPPAEVLDAYVRANMEIRRLGSSVIK